MKSRDHEHVIQKSELHVLATCGSTAIILLAVSAKLFQYGVMQFQAAAFREQFQSLTVVQIIKKLAVGADAGESKAIDDLPFPQPAQVAMRNVLITTHKSNELGGRRKPVSQNRCENV